MAYRVMEDGTAPKGLKVGDEVVTAGGTYQVKSVNADGSYASNHVSDTTTENYGGTYQQNPVAVSGVPNTGSDTRKKAAGIYAKGGTYSAAADAYRQANNAAVQQAVNGLNQQKAATNRSYADLFRQLYIDRKNTEKNLNQQMAAGGINGGAAESTRLGVATNYADNLRRGEIERQAALQNLDTEIENARLTGDMKSAEQAAALERERVNNYANMLQWLAGQERADDETAYARRRDEISDAKYYDERDYERNRDAIGDTRYQEERDHDWGQQELENEWYLNERDYGRDQTEIQRANALVEEIFAAGGTPSAELLAAAGITESNYVETMSGAYKRSEAERAASAGISAMQSGLPMSAEQRQALKDIYGYDDAAIDEASAWYKQIAQNQLRSGGGSGTYRTAKPSADSLAMAYSAFMNGSRDPAVVQILESYYGLPIDQIQIGANLTSEQPAYGGSSVANDSAMLLWELRNDQKGGTDRSGIENKVNAWLKSGTITRDQRDYLLSQF